MNPKKLVEGIDHLVSLPDVCIKVNELMDSPVYSAKAMGEIISQDTDISARLLRLVNSSFFGLIAPVETISRAVAVVGTIELRNLVMATTATRVFTGISPDLVDMQEFWRHALITGVYARELAVRSNVLHSERFFVMGMLHDIGRLAIYLMLPEQSRDIILITGGDDWLLPETEEDILGFTHMEVGTELLRNWKLPESLITVVGNHHNPLKAKEFRFEASLVHFAVALANEDSTRFNLEETVGAISSALWEITGLTMEDIIAVHDVAREKAADIMDMVVAPTVQKHQHF